MAKKQFKTESKKILDMMINSIYTHKEIFLRELISNASDAIDKLHFKSLTDTSIKLTKDDFEIRLEPNKEKRTLTITDNGCGMTCDELENNLGTIAKSGSLDFKTENSKQKDVDIIGQFGVGFYSAFMVASRIVVESRVYGCDEAYVWESSGVDGYTIKPCKMATSGTKITLFLKEDTKEEKYSQFLDEYTLKNLVKKYSDYIRYPIKMLCTHSKLKEGTEDEYEQVTEDETLNSMVPIWKKSQKSVSDEEYSKFYQDKFHDYNPPLHVIRQKTEGASDFTALLFIPSHAPYDYYTKDYEKGLQLYSSGVLITDKCKELLPDHYSFVKGLVDSSDLSLNVSRETLQQDRQVQNIAKVIERKITSELNKMRDNEREKYEKFFTAFGAQLKWGVYSTYGASKESLQDLLLFKSSFEDKFVTFKEYVSRKKEGQTKIYFATGDSVDKIKLLPQVESVTSHGFEVLFFTEDVDEFAVRMIDKYADMEFVDVCQGDLDISTDEEKESLKKQNEESKDLLQFMQETLSDEVSKVEFVDTLSNHPVSLSSEGGLSIGMEKTLKKMQGGEYAKAEIVLEINAKHPIAEKVKSLFASDKEKLATYSKILLSLAKLINGLQVENPSQLCDMISELMCQ